VCEKERERYREDRKEREIARECASKTACSRGREGPGGERKREKE